MKKVLVVDDDEAIHRLVTAIIQIIGNLEVQSAFNGVEALQRAELDPPDLIISDMSMPDMDGITLCKRIRESATLADTPILFLTARAEAQDKYDGFLQGADDYLIKPFDPTELQLRIKALLRRTGRLASPTKSDGVVGAGPLSLDLHRFLARVGERDVKLTGSEFAILRFLVDHADQVVAVETLLTQALDYPPRLGNPQVIHTHMKNIRAKLREAAGGEADFLGSSRHGYMLITKS